MIGIPDEPVDVAVDFHDIGYYGDKNDKGVRGIKPNNSWGHSFFLHLRSALGAGTDP